MQVIRVYLHHNNQRAAFVIMQCDTDFVARNKEFLKFVDDYAMGLATFSDHYNHEWKINPVTDRTFNEDVLEARKKFGEDIQVIHADIHMTHDEWNLADSSRAEVGQ